MTFEDWWVEYDSVYGKYKPLAMLAWNASTAAERQRCREIALTVGESVTIFQWLDCAVRIADKISE